MGSRGEFGVRKGSESERKKGLEEVREDICLGEQGQESWGNREGEEERKRPGDGGRNEVPGNSMWNVVGKPSDNCTFLSLPPYPTPLPPHNTATTAFSYNHIIINNKNENYK